MPTTKHIVRLPDGTTDQRVSKSRVYSHVVVGRRTQEYALAQAQSADRQRQDRRHHENERRCALGIPGDYYVSRYPDLNAKHVEDAKEFIAENPDADAFVAKRLAQRLGKVEAARIAGAYTAWTALTWSSRPDLAMKAAGHSKWAAFETRVLPTEIVARKEKA